MILWVILIFNQVEFTPIQDLISGPPCPQNDSHTFQISTEKKKVSPQKGNFPRTLASTGERIFSH